MFRAAGAYYPNFCTGITDNCTEPGCFTGISGNVWKTLYESLNFTFTVRKATSWGSQENDSGIITWTGMIGVLVQIFKTTYLRIFWVNKNELRKSRI